MGENAFVSKDGYSYLADIGSGKKISEMFSDVPYYFPYYDDEYYYSTYNQIYKDEYFCVTLKDGRSAIVDMTTGKNLYVAAGKINVLNSRYALLTKPDNEKYLYDIKDEKLLSSPVISATAVNEAVKVVKKEDKDTNSPYTVIHNGKEYGKFYQVTSQIFGKEAYLICRVYEGINIKESLYHLESMGLIYNTGVQQIYPNSYTTVDDICFLNATVETNKKVLFALNGKDSTVIEINANISDFRPYVYNKKCYAVYYYSSPYSYIFDVAQNKTTLLGTGSSYSYRFGNVAGSDNKLFYYYANGKYNYISADGSAYPQTDRAPMYMNNNSIVLSDSVNGNTVNGVTYSFVSTYGDYLFFYNNYGAGILTDKNLKVLCSNVSVSQENDNKNLYFLINSQENKRYIMYNNKISEAINYYDFNLYPDSLSAIVKKYGETRYRLYSLAENEFSGEQYDSIEIKTIYKSKDETSPVAIMKSSVNNTQHTVVKNLVSKNSKTLDYDGTNGETFKESSVSGIFTESYKDGALTALKVYDAVDFNLVKELKNTERYANAAWFFIDKEKGIDEYALVSRAGLSGLIDKTGKTLIAPKYASIKGVVLGPGKKGEFSLIVSRSGSEADTELVDKNGKSLLKNKLSIKQDSEKWFVVAADKDLKLSLHDYSGKTIAEDVLDLAEVKAPECSTPIENKVFYKIFIHGKGYKLVSFDTGFIGHHMV